MAKLNFDKECNERNQDNGDTAENVCAKEGAALALFLMLYIGLITIFHTIIYCRAKHNIAKDRERENRRDNQFKPPSEPSEPSVSITDSMQRDVSDVKIEVDTKPKKKKHKKQHSESSES